MEGKILWDSSFLVLPRSGNIALLSLEITCIFYSGFQTRHVNRGARGGKIQVHAPTVDEAL